MGNPSGTRANRWRQAVSAVSSAAGVSSAQADMWLNSFWSGMYDDELQGSPEARNALRKWLEAQSSGAPTFPVAVEQFLS